jgi:hypothetical protein
LGEGGAGAFVAEGVVLFFSILKIIYSVFCFL